MIEPQVYRVMHGVANQLAQAYRRRCWWAELPDLRNEAWIALLEAYRNPTRDPGRPLRPYLYRAAALRLRNFTLANSSPVSERQKKLHLLKGITRAALSTIRGSRPPSHAHAPGGPLRFPASSDQPGPVKCWADMTPAERAAVASTVSPPPPPSGPRKPVRLRSRRFPPAVPLDEKLHALNPPAVQVPLDEKLHALRNSEALRKRVRQVLRQNPNGSFARGWRAAIAVLLDGKEPAALAVQWRTPAVKIHRATTNGRRRLKEDPVIQRLLRER